MHAVAVNAALRFYSHCVHFFVVPFGGGTSVPKAEAALMERFQFSLRRLPIIGKFFAPDDAFNVDNIRLTVSRKGTAARCRLGLSIGGRGFFRTASFDGRLAKRLLTLFHSHFTSTATAKTAPPAEQAKEAGMSNEALAAHIQAGANIRLLRTTLSAIVEKDGEHGFRLLVAPRDGTGDKATLRELVDEVNSLVGANAPQLLEKDLADRIDAVAGFSSAPKFDPAHLRIGLRQAFLYIPGAGGKIEYAFSLEVSAPGVSGARLGPFTLESVGLSVWNTKRRNVIEKMGLSAMDDFLGE